MRLRVLLLLPLLACPEPTASTFCADLMAVDACLTEENLPDCEAAEAQCPGEVLVLESCPLQFDCP